LFAYVVCRGARPEADLDKLTEELRTWVAKQLSPIAKPDDIRFADALPKTRSGKIMRRLLRAIARGEEITQDISTLENPAIVAQLRGDPASAKSAPKPKPKAKPRAKAKAKAKTKVKVKAKNKPASRTASRRPPSSSRRARPRLKAKSSKGKGRARR
jgi:hypothetical protein